MEKKFNCYKCKHRGLVPGSSHSSCDHPCFGLPTTEEKITVLLASVGRVAPLIKNSKDLNIKGNQRGIDGGWFQFPYNFDPIWLKNCDGFEPNDVPKQKGVKE